MKKQKAKILIPELDWNPVAQFHASVTCEGRKLLLAVAPASSGWGVVALEGAADADAEEVFANHGHKYIGTYSRIEDAFAASRSFALAWSKKHRAASFGECGCDEIGGDRNG